MSKKFEAIAFLVKTSRRRSELSQSELSKLIGYKNGQFLSNLERGICGLPVAKIKQMAKVLEISEERFISAATTDFELQIKRELYS